MDTSPSGLWRFRFCVLGCFVEWMKGNRVAERGFPCQDCFDPMGTHKPTGFAFGFKDNGICETCEGRMAVRGRLVAVDPLASGPGKMTGTV